MPLFLEIIGALLGLGFLGPMLKRRYPTLTEFQAFAVSAIPLTAVVILLHVYVNYPLYPRRLDKWQREAIALNLPTVPSVAGRITFFLCTAQSALEAQDYSRQFMEVFSVHNLSASYGCDPAWNHIVVNQGKVIVAPDNDTFLRVHGIELWMLDPKQPPLAATQMEHALDAAGIPTVRKPDIRLAGIEAYDQYRFPINDPQCVIVIGSKPSWNLRTDTFYLRRYIAFRLGEVGAFWKAWLSGAST
jgi:hypothetical protein